jgi:5-(carboxyamino)imidazole ribonucleotide synthase
MRPTSKALKNLCQTIGIIGNGQLARMLALSAYNLGFKIAIYAEDDNGPANLVTKFNTIGNFNDTKKLLEFAKEVDFLTYEFENINEESLKIIEQEYPKKIFPKSNALYISKNRFREKTFVNNLGIKTADFWMINSFDELRNIVIENPKNAFILKTCQDGYDGKGQFIIKNSYDLADIKLEIEKFTEGKYILEKKVNFKKEASCIIVRDKNAENEIFPIPENIHINGILHSSFVPNRLSDDVNNKIKDMSIKIANELDYIGVLVIEFFIDVNDHVIVNEIAPRVHNSGHYTTNSCNISQFEAHVRAITGLNLKKIQLLAPCKMRNFLGNDVEYVDDFINLDNAYIHLYGKDQIKKGRKMGHVNILQHKIENDFLDDDESDDCDANKDEYWNESLLNSLIK